MPLFSPDLLLAGGAFELHGWMDSGTIHYYSTVPLPLAYLAFVAPLAVAAWLKSRWVAYYSSVLGLVVLAHLNFFGLPFVANLSTYGWMMLLSLPFFAWRCGRVPGSSRRKLFASLIVLELGLVLMGFPGMLKIGLQSCPATMRNIATAVEIYRMDKKGRSQPTIIDLVPDYLRTQPNCSGVPGSGYTLSYPEGRLEIRCDSPIHRRTEFGPGLWIEPAPKAELPGEVGKAVNKP